MRVALSSNVGFVMKNAKWIDLIVPMIGQFIPGRMAAAQNQFSFSHPLVETFGVMAVHVALAIGEPLVDLPQIIIGRVASRTCRKDMAELSKACIECGRRKCNVEFHIVLVYISRRGRRRRCRRLIDRLSIVDNDGFPQAHMWACLRQFYGGGGDEALLGKRDVLGAIFFGHW